MEKSPSLAKPRNLLPRPFPYALFTESKTKAGVPFLVSEASTLDREDGTPQHIQKLFPDAYGVGLAISFETKNKIVAYRLHRIGMDITGSIERWEYLPTSQSIAEWPDCRKTKVFVYNG